MSTIHLGLRGNSPPKSSYSTILVPGKSPKKVILKKDEMEIFSASYFSDFIALDDSISSPGFLYLGYDDYVLYYKMDMNTGKQPEILEVII